MIRLFAAFLIVVALSGCQRMYDRQFRYIEHGTSSHVIEHYAQAPAWTSPSPHMPPAPDWQMTGHKSWMSGPIAPYMRGDQWAEYYATGKLPYRLPSTHTRKPKFWHRKCDNNGCWLTRR